MVRGLLLIGAGTAGAFYFLDAKKGEKRRKKLEKQIREAYKAGSNVFQDYSKKYKEQATRLSQTLNESAVQYGREAKQLAGETMKNGTGWSPSARFVGALGSALAFYGVGRRGPAGTLLRTLSLGLFTKALIASR